MTASELRRLKGVAERKGMSISELLLEPWREEKK